MVDKKLRQVFVIYLILRNFSVLLGVGVARVKQGGEKRFKFGRGVVAKSGIGSIIQGHAGGLSVSECLT